MNVAGRRDGDLWDSHPEELLEREPEAHRLIGEGFCRRVQEGPSDPEMAVGNMRVPRMAARLFTVSLDSESAGTCGEEDYGSRVPV